MKRVEITIKTSVWVKKDCNDIEAEYKYIISDIANKEFADIFGKDVVIMVGDVIETD